MNWCLGVLGTSLYLVILLLLLLPLTGLEKEDRDKSERESAEEMRMVGYSVHSDTSPGSSKPLPGGWIQGLGNAFLSMSGAYRSAFARLVFQVDLGTRMLWAVMSS